MRSGCRHGRPIGEGGGFGKGNIYGRAEQVQSRRKRVENEIICHNISSRPLEWRVAQLQALLRYVDGVFRKAIEDALIRCYDENEDLFAEALAKDLRKPRQEAVMLEVTISNPRFQRIVFRLNS